MLTGHKRQALQSISWAIQGRVPYDKMPVNYKRLVDELIPDMKNQVNGQAFADIEDGFEGKVNRTTKKVSDAISKGTGGHVHADIKVGQSLHELGREAANKPGGRRRPEISKNESSRSWRGRTKLLALLIATHPESLQRVELTRQGGYSNAKSGGFAAPLARPIELGFVEAVKNGVVRGSEMLFLKGTARSR